MTDVTNILGQIEDGDPSAAEELLPLVYEELRKLAAAKMGEERCDNTFQATALVHEAYLRLVDVAIHLTHRESRDILKKSQEILPQPHSKNSFSRQSSC